MHSLTHSFPPLRHAFSLTHTLTHVHFCARCWTFETSVLLDVSISNNIPNNDFIQYYGPDYHLHLQPSRT